MSYWQDRQAKTQAALTAKNIRETETQLRRYYKRTMDSIIGQFEATYNKILLSIEDGKQPTPADLYKLDTYWKQQAQIAAELNKLGDKQANLFSKKFMDEWHNIYEAVAAKDDLYFSEVSFENAKQMINQIWCADGKSWSSRVWGNTALLQQELNDNLIECLLAGRKTSELKQKLQERFNVSYNRADSIVRTEIAHIQTQAAKQRYEDAGVKEVEVWADEDERRCDVCGKLHQKRFPVGANMPIPAHPRCRCCIIPVVDDKKEVEIFVSASYNDDKPCFEDNVVYYRNQDCRQASRQQSTNFVTRDINNIESLYGEAAEKIKPIDGYYDIKAHGLYNSIKVFNTPINAKTLSHILMSRQDYKIGNPIRLLCCFTGEEHNGRCFAQDLANYMGVEVIAPDFELIVDGDGNLYKERERIDKTSFKQFKPKRRN